MIFIYVPCQNIETAKTIAKILVEKRMAGKTLEKIPLSRPVIQDNHSRAPKSPRHQQEF